mgnify:CR=1 FL=1
MLFRSMAKAFFYRSEWLPSTIKCLELAEQFPDSRYSPDVHLLASKNYLIQRNIPKARIMLSRTVDVAWQQQRYDVLSEAFQLMAEEAITQGDFDAAERPYRQAIAQCTDEEQRAKWQTDLIHYMESSHPEVVRDIVEKRAITDANRPNLLKALDAFRNTWQA